jgi:hypothetical protein
VTRKKKCKIMIEKRKKKEIPRLKTWREINNRRLKDSRTRLSPLKSLPMSIERKPRKKRPKPRRSRTI